MTVDEGVHQGLRQVMEEESNSILKTFPPDSFQHLFWTQQLEAAEKNPRQMRWHPLMVRWCLYLRHRSSGAYEALRESGCLKLPSQRTLRDYTYYTKAAIGFSKEVDKMLKEAAEISTCEPRQLYTLLALDEMHIREDLVYDKHSGALVGFANLGDINMHLQAYEHSLLGESPTSEPLAGTMMVFMVRGLFSKLQFAYAQFPCCQVTGDLLYDPFWEAVYRIERCGLKVRSVRDLVKCCTYKFYTHSYCCPLQVLGATLDGNAVNRRLIKLHPSPVDGVVYKVLNPFATDGRSLFFYSDPPHLVKTARNCLASNKRSLWVNWPKCCKLYVHCT